MRVEISAEMLRWACLRVGLDTRIVARKLPQLSAWVKGERTPTLKQLERFAKLVHVPVGFLFLPAPPAERLPIPDFRTLENAHIGHPSPDLLETIYLCQQRQEWYRGYSLSIHDEPLSFVGSATLRRSVRQVAEEIRRTLCFDIDARGRLPTWEAALRQFIAQCDEAGIMVMVSGIVGSNTHRGLSVEEFRGFALCDDRAPLIFINGKDTKSAQMFTLAHELAHIWLGETGVSDAGLKAAPSNDSEVWCNEVAAEILAPLDSIKVHYRTTGSLPDEVARLARIYKVSTLVIVRRILDARFITHEAFERFYNDELNRLSAMKRGSGGNYYLTQPARMSKRFARALIASTLEGQTLHRDAFQLLGLRKMATFRELRNRLGGC